MELLRKKQGFTLLEIMVIVAIIGLLTAISIPAFKKSRISVNTCQITNNLRILTEAFDQESMNRNLPNSNTLTISEVNTYIKGGYARLEWPEGLAPAVSTTRSAISINYAGKTFTCDNLDGD